MDKTDAIGELCKQLESFHISVRLQRQAEEEALARKQKKAQKQDARWFLNELPFAWESGLPNPEPGCRPCWEPPVLDYSWYETLLEAEKELAAKEGNKDIAWRRDFTDNLVERQLLACYDDETCEQARECRKGGRLKELSFWNGLRREVLQDYWDATDDYCVLGRPHGRTLEHEALMSRLRKLALTKDAKFGDIRWYMWV